MPLNSLLSVARTMNYYTVLEATNSLLENQRWKLKRSRRRSDGPSRYMVFDQHRVPVFVGEKKHPRPLGFTLREILIILEAFDDQTLSVSANHLLSQLDIISELD